MSLQIQIHMNRGMPVRALLNLIHLKLNSRRKRSDIGYYWDIIAADDRCKQNSSLMMIQNYTSLDNNIGDAFCLIENVKNKKA
jgi:hypothetical protein